MKHLRWETRMFFFLYPDKDDSHVPGGHKNNFVKVISHDDLERRRNDL